jgi:hypothetical protein
MKKTTYFDLRFIIYILYNYFQRTIKLKSVKDDLRTRSIIKNTLFTCNSVFYFICLYVGCVNYPRNHTLIAEISVACCQNIQDVVVLNQYGRVRIQRKHVVH